MVSAAAATASSPLRSRTARRKVAVSTLVSSRSAQPHLASWLLSDWSGQLARDRKRNSRETACHSEPTVEIIEENKQPVAKPAKHWQLADGHLPSIAQLPF
jgi:hypothetical protein